MLTELKPEKGRLLISEPFLPDPNFSRSVVLLAENSEEGALGFVMNNKSSVMLSDLLPDLQNGNFPIYLGGPVETDNLFFIHRCYDKLLSGESITTDIFWGDNFELLKELIDKNAIKDNEIRFFLGYSGWSEGQLQSEIEQNTWIVSDQFSGVQLFNMDENVLWKSMLTEMGSKFAHVGNFPINPNLN